VRVESALLVPPPPLGLRLSLSTANDTARLILRLVDACFIRTGTVVFVVAAFVLWMLNAELVRDAGVDMAGRGIGGRLGTGTGMMG